MRYAHVSLRKRHDKVGICMGGVEKFGVYLQKAIPELELISWSDYPHWLEVKEPDYIKAELLSSYCLKSGILDKDSVVVVDGYWGSGLEGNVKRVVSVVHGSYFGRFLQSQIYPWGEVVEMDQVQEQVDFWNRPEVEVVCVALESLRELKLAGVEKGMTVIHHGIDLDVYRLMGLERDCIMFAGTSARKGADIVYFLQEAHEIPIEHMAEFSGLMPREAGRLNKAKLLVAPTRHEGNAYLLIEALACGVPLLTYTTGLALEMDDRCGIIVDDLTVGNYLRLIRVFERQDQEISTMMAREWAEENCSFGSFEAKWRETLEVVN